MPDVAYNAAVYHGALTYLDIPGSPCFYLFGGTSAGSPQWAAIAAIADQKAGRRLGFINAALYLWSLFPSKYATLFHDVTSGNNTFVDGSLTTYGLQRRHRLGRDHRPGHAQGRSVGQFPHLVYFRPRC